MRASGAVIFLVFQFYVGIDGVADETQPAILRNLALFLSKKKNFADAAR